MGKIVRMALAITLAAAGVPSSLVASQSETGNLKGTAYNSNLQPLAKALVQIRDIQTGEAVQTTWSGQSGEFSFTNLRPANYTLELIDETGRVVGMSAPFRLSGGISATMSVVRVADGAVSAAGGGGGISLFGMGPTATLAVLGAATAAGVTAVVATRPDASPSR